MVLDPVLFAGEARDLEATGLDLHQVLKVSRKAHLILPTHRLLDAANEAAKGKGKISIPFANEEELARIMNLFDNLKETADASGEQ